jgi:membrane-bound lytic murein transglycosylase B
MSTGSFFPASLTAAAFVVLGATVYSLSAARAEPGAAEALLSSPFTTCVQEVGTQAQVKRISPEVISRSLGGLSPDPDILAGVQQQPEFIKPIWDYLDATVSETRINTGRSKLAEWSQVLDAIETAYGVDRHIVLAIWGIESSYGAVLDDLTIVKPVIRSLATLACGDPNREHAKPWGDRAAAAVAPSSFAGRKPG